MFVCAFEQGMEVIDERHAVGVAVANAVKEVLVETGLVPRPAAEAMAERTTNIHGDIRQHYHQVSSSRTRHEGL